MTEFKVKKIFHIKSLHYFVLAGEIRNGTVSNQMKIKMHGHNYSIFAVEMADRTGENHEESLVSILLKYKNDIDLKKLYANFFEEQLIYIT